MHSLFTPSVHSASPDALDSEERLRESENRVQLLQAVIEAAVVISSAPTLRETADRAGERAAEIIGSRAGVVLTVQPPHELEDTSSGDSANGRLVVPLCGRNGQSLGVLWLSDKQAGPFTEDDERLITHLAQVASNAMEYHQAREEMELRVAEQTQLARTNAELEQFTYVASHDLQEPLRAVAGYCDLLHASCQDQLNAECLEYLQHAVQGAKRMQSLITGLLELSRVRTRGKPSEPVDSQLMLATVLEHLGPTIAGCNAVVTSGELPTIHADGEQIMQVFQHLLENAIKFRSGRAPRIHVVAQPHESGWRFSVADNGIGIDPRYADRLFVIFQRLHTRAKYPAPGSAWRYARKSWRGMVAGSGWSRNWIRAPLFISRFLRAQHQVAEFARIPKVRQPPEFWRIPLQRNNSRF